MRLFVDDMSAIGQNLDKASDSYRQAMKKLATGRGNLLAQAEAFRGMGVEVKREINPDLLEQATQDEEAFALPDADALTNAPDENSYLAAFRVAGER